MKITEILYATIKTRIDGTYDLILEKNKDAEFK